MRDYANANAGGLIKVTLKNDCVNFIIFIINLRAMQYLVNLGFGEA
jgi:hypothetical protein